MVMQSGVSWLRDRLQAKLEERQEFLKEAVANGVPVQEYPQFCGRYKESTLMSTYIDEIFGEFYRDEEEDDGDELPDTGGLESTD